MSSAEQEVDRVLTMLRNKMRERGFTQLQVQKPLGWGRSYISQLMIKQKKLRVDQVLAILDVIGVDPADFFSELYTLAGHGAARPVLRGALGGSGDDEALRRRVAELQDRLEGILDLLAAKEVLDREDIVALLEPSEPEAD